jgi:serine/threonine protein kinase/tetratricopeptide (TPR) repeat protein
VQRHVGRYEVREVIGEGGMGQVLKAWDPKMYLEVALKVINPALLGSGKVLARAQRELQVLLALRAHPNIVTVIDYVEEPFALVMEYLDGQELGSLIEHAPQGMAQGDAIRYTIPVLDAVAFAHQKGVLHRDIKPGNVMVVQLGSQEQVKVLDFGLAGFLSDDVRLTRTGARMGTQGYMAPEQHLAETVDERTDIYALGVVLFQMVTGHMPYEAHSSSDYRMMKAQLEEPIPLPSSLNPNVSPSMDEIVLRSTARHPQDRYPSCEAFAEDLRKVDHGGVIDYGLRSQVPKSVPAQSRPVPPPAKVPVAPTMFEDSPPTNPPISPALDDEPVMVNSNRGGVLLIWTMVAIALLSLAILVVTTGGGDDEDTKTKSAANSGQNIVTPPPPPRQVTAPVPPKSGSPPAPPKSAKIASPPPAVLPPAADAPTPDPPAPVVYAEPKLNHGHFLPENLLINELMKVMHMAGTSNFTGLWGKSIATFGKMTGLSQRREIMDTRPWQKRFRKSFKKKYKKPGSRRRSRAKLWFHFAFKEGALYMVKLELKKTAPDLLSTFRSRIGSQGSYSVNRNDKSEYRWNDGKNRFQIIVNRDRVMLVISDRKRAEEADQLIEPVHTLEKALKKAHRYTSGRRGHLDLAVNYANEALQIDPESPKAHLTLCRAQYGQGNLYAADAACNKALEKTMSEDVKADAYYYRGCLEMVRGNRSEGIRFLKLASGLGDPCTLCTRNQAKYRWKLATGRLSGRSKLKALRLAVKYSQCFTTRGWARGGFVPKEFGFANRRRMRAVASEAFEYEDYDVGEIEEKEMSSCSLGPRP